MDARIFVIVVSQTARVTECRGQGDLRIVRWKRSNVRYQDSRAPSRSRESHRQTSPPAPAPTAAAQSRGGIPGHRSPTFRPPLRDRTTSSLPSQSPVQSPTVPLPTTSPHAVLFCTRLEGRGETRRGPLAEAVISNPPFFIAATKKQRICPINLHLIPLGLLRGYLATRHCVPLFS